MKIVIFDLGGVCLSNYWSNEQRKLFSEKFGLNFESVQLYHSENRKNLCIGNISEEEYIHNLFKSQNKEPKIEKAITFIREQNFAFEEVLKFIEKIKDKFEIFAFTNEIKEAAEFRIKRFNLERYFKKIFVSSVIGYMKPDKEAYFYVLRELNVEPSQVIFVDNSELNVNAAKKLGMIGIHFKYLEQLREDFKGFIVLDKD